MKIEVAKDIYLITLVVAIHSDWVLEAIFVRSPANSFDVARSVERYILTDPY